MFASTRNVAGRSAVTEMVLEERNFSSSSSSKSRPEISIIEPSPRENKFSVIDDFLFGGDQR